MLEFLLILCAAFVLAPMILGPFLVKFSHRIMARAVIRHVAPEALEPKIREFIDQAKPEFEALGFRFAGYMMMPDYIPKVTSYFGLFRNDVTKTGAMVAYIIHAKGQAVRYYEFSNIYSNGRIIDISNAPLKGSYKNPDKITYRYPNIQSIRKLYDINLWVTGRDMKKSVPQGLVPGREMEMVARALEEEAALQMKYGYYALSGDQTQYRLTWKGAFILTEMQVFPVKQILSYLDLQAAKKAIAGMPP